MSQEKTIRKIARVDTLRSHLIPVTRKIRQGEFSKLDRIYGERLIIEANWMHRLIYVTVVKGCYYPEHVREGFSEIFDVKYMFPRNEYIKDVILKDESDLSKRNFDKLYQEYILNLAKDAQKILGSQSDEDEISNEVKSSISAILNPYKDMYDYD